MRGALGEALLGQAQGHEGLARAAGHDGLRPVVALEAGLDLVDGRLLVGPGAERAGPARGGVLGVARHEKRPVHVRGGHVRRGQRERGYAPVLLEGQQVGVHVCGDVLRHGGNDHAGVAPVSLGGGEEGPQVAQGDLMVCVEVLALHRPVGPRLIGALGHDVDARVVPGAQRVVRIVPAPDVPHDLPHLRVVAQVPGADPLPQVALVVGGSFM